MDVLKKKFENRRGASILMALLFMLVCMMAGTSILMAASSNAGKVRNNKDEQQKYLTLSSALNLLVDELESVKYVGTYVYTKEEMPPVYDESTHELVKSGYDRHIYVQVKTKAVLDGSGSGASGSLLKWDNLNALPLYNDLDKVFADNFKVPTSQQTSGDEYQFVEASSFPTAGPYVLEITADVDKDIYGGLSDTVRIMVTLREDGSLVLDGALMKEGVATKYTMMALLRPDPDNWPQKRLVLKNSPGPNNTYETAPVQWKLKHIANKIEP